jgi:hypothetical protein
MTLTWSDVERVTQGRLGRTVRTVCPFCSDSRRTINRRKPVFAIKLKEPDFAIYRCAHCDESGYVHPEKSAVIDLAERRAVRAAADKREREDLQRRTSSALQRWRERKPFRGSPAETYLRDTRGLGDWLDAFDLDQSLGFHPSCPFGQQQRLPCMLALVRNIQTDEPQAIHRTALKLGPRPDRLKRLSWGPVAGGAIKLSLYGDVTTGLLIGEGIETTLSASLALSFRPCWSVISKSGIESFPVLSGLEAVTVAVDRDRDGAGQKAADKCIKRLTDAGVEVTTTHSPVGKDFNDLLVGGLS